MPTSIPIPSGFVLSPSVRASTPTVPTAPFTLTLTGLDGFAVVGSVAPVGGQDFLLSDGGAGGTFAPTSVTIPEGQSSATFTYAHPRAGIYTFSAGPNGGLLAGVTPQTATVTISATGTSGGTSSMGTAKSKAGTIFNKGYLSAIDASGNEIVFGVLQKFGFKNNLGLKELMDPDSLVATSVGYSERKITLNAATAVIKINQYILAMGGTQTTVAAVTDPTPGPTLTAGAGPTSFTAGFVGVAYAWRTPYGTTKISPVVTVSVTATQKITVTALTLPAGCTFIDVHVTSQSYTTAPLAAAAQLYKLATIAGSVAYDIVTYGLTSANLPPTVSGVGIAQNLYTLGIADEPLSCTLQWKSQRNGGGVNMIAYGVVMPDVEMNGDMYEFIIPNFSANVYGDDTLNKVVEILIPS